MVSMVRLMSDVANGALFGARFLSVSVITKTGIKRAPSPNRATSGCRFYLFLPKIGIIMANFYDFRSSTH